MFAKRSRSGACLAWEARLEDYLEGRLGGDQTAAVQEHVHSCSGCTAAVERAGASIGLLEAAGARPMPVPDQYFATRVMAAIRREGSERELWKPLEIAGWELCWLAAAAALILAVFALRYQLAGPQLSISPSAQQSQVQELINVPMYQPGEQDDALLVAASNDHGR